MMASRLTTLIALACLFSSGISASAWANPTDPDGYIMNWPGNVVPQFNGSPLPIPSAQTTASALASALTQQALCAALKSAVLSAGGSQVASFDSCSPPLVSGTSTISFELRGKILQTNTVGLKILIDDIAFGFTANSIGKPKVNVTMNLEIDSGIIFADTITGSIMSSTTPMSALGASVKISNVQDSTNNVLANIFGGSSLATVAEKISQQQGPNGDLTTQLNNAVDMQNDPLHVDASKLGNAIETGLVQPKDPNANSFFFLSVNIDAQQSLDIDFQRNTTAPVQPTNCIMSSISYAIVTAKCYSTTANGIITFDQVDQMMLFRINPDPGLADDGLSNSWDTPPPRYVAPLLEDSFFQSEADPPKTATYRICAQNLFGRACGPVLPVTLNVAVAPGGPCW